MSTTATLEERIKLAKRFLNGEITQHKLSEAAGNLQLAEIGSQLNTIHEIERVGIRNLNEIHFAKISRILTSVEARIQLSKN